LAIDDVVSGVFDSVIDTFKHESRKGRYLTDPVAWAEDVLGIKPWSKQRDIMQSVQDNNHVAVRSCHGSGKSFIAALLACWWVSTRPIGDAIVVTTAPTFAQVHSILWEDIRKFHIKAKERYEAGLAPMKLPGYVTQGDQWKSDEGVLIGFGRKPADNNDHGFQGIHRPYVLVIIDESCGIKENLFTAVEAITTTENSRILAIGNPDDPATTFKKFFGVDPNWYHLDVSSFDSPNFTREHEGHYDACTHEDEWMQAQCQKREWAKRWDRDKALMLPHQVLQLLPNHEWVEERRVAWGVNSPLWMSKVLGEFPLQSVNTLFSADTLNRGIDTVITPGRTDPVILGVDLARFGPNYSTIYSNIGGQIRLVDKWGGKADEQLVDGMESAARVHTWAQKLGATEVRIDAEGIGGPILDQVNRLSEGSYQVVQMKGSRTSPDNYRWVNSRAYWYDKLREDMFTGKIDIDFNDKVLLEELEQIQYHFKNRFKSLQIESKEEMEKRGVMSPDHADAAVYAAADMSYITNNPFGQFEVGQKVSLSTTAFLGFEDRGWVISPV
jgi:hypothetical protein